MAENFNALALAPEPEFRARLLDELHELLDLPAEVGEIGEIAEVPETDAAPRAGEGPDEVAGIYVVTDGSIGGGRRRRPLLLVALAAAIVIGLLLLGLALRHRPDRRPIGPNPTQPTTPVGGTSAAPPTTGPTVEVPYAIESDSRALTSLSSDAVSTAVCARATRCLFSYRVVGGLVPQSTATGIGIDSSDPATILFYDYARPDLFLATQLYSLTVPGCGQGLLATVSPLGTGSTGAAATVRSMWSGRTDALGQAVMWAGSGPGSTPTALREQGTLRCLAGESEAPPAIGNGVAVDFSSRDDPTAGVSWSPEPVCRRATPTDCLTLSASWNTLSGSFDGADARIVSHIDDGVSSSPGTVELIAFAGDVAGCGAGDVLIAQFSTGPGRAEWRVMTGSGAKGLRGIAGAGTATIDGGTTHYTGWVHCG